MYINKQVIKKAVMVLITIPLTVVTLSSCAKKATGIRAITKTSSTDLNSSVSTAANQQAAANGVNYTIHSITTPQKDSNTGKSSVSVEILMPNNQILPVTTYHDNQNTDSAGVFNDSARMTQVKVESRCTADDCSKYLLLVSVWKNNAIVFQQLAISYKNDCKFFIISASNSVYGSVGRTYQNLNEAATSSYSAVAPKNDIESCTTGI